MFISVRKFIIFGIVSFVICVLHVSGYGNHAKTDGGKARKARYRARLDKAEAWIAQAEKDILKVGHEEKTETQPNPLDEYNEVIGKTKIVYLEDPDVARKTPTRSEPMKKEPIEEDEDIDPDDVIDGFSSQKGLTESEKRELMSNDGCVPDPDFQGH